MQSLIRSYNKKHLRNWKSSRAGVIARYVFGESLAVCEVTGRTFEKIDGVFKIPAPNFKTGQAVMIERDANDTHIIGIDGVALHIAPHTDGKPGLFFGERHLHALTNDITHIELSDVIWLTYRRGSYEQLEAAQSMIRSTATVTAEADYLYVGAGVRVVEVTLRPRYSFNRGGSTLSFVSGSLSLPTYTPIKVASTAERDALVYSSGREPTVGAFANVNVTTVDGLLVSAAVRFSTSILKPVQSLRYLRSEASVTSIDTLFPSTHTYERITLVCVHELVQVYVDLAFVGTLPKQDITLTGVIGLQFFDLDLSASSGRKNFSCCDTLPTFDVLSGKLYESRIYDHVQGLVETGTDVESIFTGAAKTRFAADIPPAPFRGFTYVDSFATTGSGMLVDFNVGSVQYSLRATKTNLLLYKNNTAVGRGLLLPSGPYGVEGHIFDVGLIVAEEGIYFRFENMVHFYEERIDPAIPITNIMVGAQSQTAWLESLTTFIADDFVEPYGYNIGSPSRGQSGFVSDLPDNAKVPLAEAVLELNAAVLEEAEIVENAPPVLTISDLRVVYLVDSGYEGLNVKPPKLEVFESAFAYLVDE